MTDEYDHIQAIHKQIGGWFDAFVSSPQYDRLSEIERHKAPGIVRFYTEYSFRHIGATPEQWNQSVLTECCLEILPQKMSAEHAFFRAIAPVLSGFFEFLADRNLLSQARDLSKAVAELNEEIVAASQDPRNWGPSKSFIMAAEQAGVDTCDENALRGFMVEYNLRQLARLEAAEQVPAPPTRTPLGPAVPMRHTQPKPGRNDPCPCGSGKKYKKCCGA